MKNIKKTLKKFLRHQLISFTQTLAELLERKIFIKNFWKMIDENEKHTL